jgi:hypothetical protein
MSSTDTSVGIGQLNDAMKTLQVHWDEATNNWNDMVRHDFEERYLEPLRRHVDVTLRDMNHLAQILAKVKRDCQ